MDNLSTLICIYLESLFSLKPEELGLVPSVNSQVKVRVIPMELQRLFAQLLTLDQEVCSTARLTESFGWSNNEELQQHDVQELNRILFNAIEHSLVNTSKAKLIQENYRGTCVNKVKCLSCQNVFEREVKIIIYFRLFPDIMAHLDRPSKKRILTLMINYIE